MTTHFMATVEFDAKRSLPDLATKLGLVFRVPLTKEDTGRFDEVPAYVGSSGEVRLTLFGPTEEQEERECILEVSLRTSLPATQALANELDFLQSIFVDSDVDSTGHVNCSNRLASLLQLNGFGDCKAVR